MSEILNEWLWSRLRRGLTASVGAQNKTAPSSPQRALGLKQFIQWKPQYRTLFRPRMRSSWTPSTCLAVSLHQLTARGNERGQEQTTPRVREDRKLWKTL